MSYQILTVITSSHQVLYDKFFLPTLPKEFNVKARKILNNKNGDFGSKSWCSAITVKYDFILKHLHTHPGEIVLWSDVDVVFHRPFANLIPKFMRNYDLAFQKELDDVNSTHVNTGFMIIRSTPEIIKFFEAVQSDLPQNPNDQFAVDERLTYKEPTLPYLTLPDAFYSTIHGIIPTDVILYHAVDTGCINEMSSVEQKIFRLNDFLEAVRTGRQILINPLEKKNDSSS